MAILDELMCWLKMKPRLCDSTGTAHDLNWKRRQFKTVEGHWYVHGLFGMCFARDLFAILAILEQLGIIHHDIKLMVRYFCSAFFRM